MNESLLCGSSLRCYVGVYVHIYVCVCRDAYADATSCNVRAFGQVVHPIDEKICGVCKHTVTLQMMCTMRNNA